MNYTREELIEQLKSNVVSVTFEKVDGSERVMKCTLAESMIPVEEKETSRTKKANDSVISVWDMEKDGWRSFRVESVKNAECILRIVSKDNPAYRQDVREKYH